MGKETDKRWKGYLIDWPTLSAMDSEEFKLYELNQQQVAVLLMVLEYQKWTTRWTNLELTKDELQAYIGDIELRLMTEKGSSMSCDDIEDCLETSEIINDIESEVSENTTNITNVQNQVTVLQSNETQTNIVPPMTDYTSDDDICNAASYIASKIIDAATETWEQSGELTIEEFLIAMLEGAVGWVGDFLTSLYNSAIPANTSTPSELAAAESTLVKALYCNSLDKAAARAEIAASGSITTNAKNLIVATLDAITDAKFALWAFVGKETVSGSCTCDQTKVWDFSLGSQLGWAAQGGRASWSGNGWTGVNLGYGNLIVVQKTFTWPTDLVIKRIRYYIENHTPAVYNYAYTTPYVNESFSASGFGTDGFQVVMDIDKEDNTGLGAEYTIWDSGAKKLYKYEVDYEGTAPSDW